MWEGVVNWLLGSYEPSKFYDYLGLKESVDELMDSVNNKIIEFIVTHITNISTTMINLMLEIPLKFLSSEKFQNLYFLITKIALIVIIPVIMYFGIKLIAGQITEFEVWESIKRYFFMPFFLVIMPILVRKLIIIVNEISNILLNNIGNQFILQDTPEQLEPKLIILTIIYVIYLTRILLWYSTRNIKLMYLIISAPLLYLLWSFPGKFDKQGKWINEVSTTIFTQVAHIIQLLILVTLTSANFSQFEELVMQVGCLILMTQTESWLSEYLDGNSITLPKISNYSGKIKNLWGRVINK